MRCACCGVDAHGGARFCAACGARLADDATAEEQTAARECGERRQLTVLFCDLVGSTSLAERLDAEDWRDILAEYHAAAAAAVTRWGGHVAKYLGDGLLVYFGWPLAREDDPERAVRAGLAILDAMAPLHAALGASDEMRLRVRVGLHTGPVVIDDGGEVFGATANVAAHVQAVAEPDTVVITAATQRLVSGMFVVEDRGPLSLRSGREPLTHFRVVQPSGVRSRLDAAAGRLTRFVGREVELATLVERWERAQDGEGQSVLVVGESGVGKSRLVYQLRERLAGVPHTWLECGASPYSQGTPFQPLIALTSQALAFASDDTVAARLARLEHGMGTLASPTALALMADFVGLPTPTPLAMDPDLKRRKTIDLLARLNLAQSEVQPLVVVVEDLHWCDASTLELLGRLVAQSATARVLLLMTARPEFTPPWSERENLARMSLGRLTRRHTREMLAALGSTNLPAETVDALVARADGVPLYVEELTKSVVAPGAARGVEAIPATLADSLMARLDQLGPAKDVAQRAAVLGREFAYPLLAATSGLEDASLRQCVARLAEAEILFVRGEPPDATFAFKHALVQEAAYESLLKRTRQQLHGCVVDVLVEKLPERAAAEPELVARHAEAACRIDTAIAYYQRAGEQAQAHSAHEESVRHFEQAIALLTAQPDRPERNAREAALQLELAESRTVALGYTSPEVERAHARARDLCEAAGDRLGLGFALSRLAVFAHNCGQAERACTLAAQALTIGNETGDPALRLRAHCDLGLAEVFRGRFASSLAHLDCALELYQPDLPHTEVPATGNPGVRALSASAWDLFVLGFPDRALARAREGVSRARELGHPFSVAHALFFETVVHALRCDAAAQRERAAEVVALSEAHGFPFWMGVGRTFHAAARVAVGESDAVAEMRAGFALTAATGSRGGAPGSLAQLARAYLIAGNLDEARAAADAGLALSAQIGQPFFDSPLHNLQGAIILAGGGEPAEAEAAFRRALDIARVQEAKLMALRAATSLARLWRDQRKFDQARDLLAPLYASLTEGFDTSDLVAARALLTELT